MSEFARFVRQEAEKEPGFPHTKFLVPITVTAAHREESRKRSFPEQDLWLFREADSAVGAGDISWDDDAEPHVKMVIRSVNPNELPP